MNRGDVAQPPKTVVVFGLALALMSCRSNEPAQPTTVVDLPVAVDTRTSLKRAGEKAEGVGRRSEKSRLSKTQTRSCEPDTRGQRTDLALRAKLGHQLDAIWKRERALQTRPEWQAYMPSGEGTAGFKLVSFEMSNGAEAGHYSPKFRCVRLRFLAKEEPSKVVELIQNGWRLARKSVAHPLTGMTKDGSILTVSVSLNQDLLTQVDVALVPKEKVALDMPFGVGRRVLTFFRSQALSAFEYGVYASARPGLKFPGLERAILLIDMDEKLVTNRLQESGFVKQERGEDLFLKENETYTFRRYAKAHLSLSWQLRLKKDELQPLLIQYQDLPSKTSP